MKKPEQLIGLEQMICTAASVKPESLKSPSKARKLADARHVLWCIAYEQLGLTYAELATYYDRDYTAVMHGVKRMTGTPLIKTLLMNLRTKNPELLQPVSRETGADWQI